MLRDRHLDLLPIPAQIVTRVTDWLSVPIFADVTVIVAKVTLAVRAFVPIAFLVPVFGSHLGFLIPYLKAHVKPLNKGRSVANSPRLLLFSPSTQRLSRMAVKPIVVGPI